MLPKSKKQKGKRLEKYVTKELKKVFDFVYSRADSGSGKFHKEDITLPDYVPLSIECKNQAELKIETWFRKMEENCPADKYPVLIYKTDYQEPKVVMRISDFLNFLSGSKQYYDLPFKDLLGYEFSFKITFEFKDFVDLLLKVFKVKQKKL